jgi:trimeric autotransporter adhesin
MKKFFFLFCLIISIPLVAQHWAGLGKFNHGVASLSADSISDELYIIGGYSQFNSDTLGGIGRWNGNIMKSFGCGVGWDCNTPIIPASFYPNVNAIVRYNNDIYVTGYFYIAGNITVNSLARWDGFSWNNIGTGLKGTDGSIGSGLALKVINNELYVCGDFDCVAGISANCIAKFNGTIWSSVNNFPRISIAGSANRIYDVVFFNNELYVCGNFYNSSLGIYNIIKWDGVNWVSVGNGIRGSVIDVNNMLIYKNKLVVAGRFSKSDHINNPGENIGYWDGNQWSELGSGTDGMIWDIKVFNNDLYACGAFQHAGNIVAEELAKWDGSKWCGYGTLFDNIVTTLDFYHDTLYIGGGFWTINGDSISRVAKWIGGNYVDTCGSIIGIEQIENQQQLVYIYPNPAADYLTIEGFNEHTIAQVYDISGKLILNKQLNTNQIDISSLAKGLYFIKLSTEEGSVVRKFVKN